MLMPSNANAKQCTLLVFSSYCPIPKTHQIEYAKDRGIENSKYLPIQMSKRKY